VADVPRHQRVTVTRANDGWAGFVYIPHVRLPSTLALRSAAGMLPSLYGQDLFLEYLNHRNKAMTMGPSQHPLGGVGRAVIGAAVMALALGVGAGCDVRSHVVSESVEWRSADVDGVTSGQCSRPVPTVTCVAGNGWVRSSRGKLKGSRPVRGLQVRGRLGMG
jgi:hypothetical protein